MNEGGEWEGGKVKIAACTGLATKLGKGDHGSDFSRDGLIAHIAVTAFAQESNHLPRSG